MRNYFTHEALTEPHFRNFIFAPIIGLAFLMFLPFIGFYLVASALVIKANGLLKSLVHSQVAAPVTMDAYLTGKEPGVKLDEASDSYLADLQKEIERLRKLEKPLDK